MITAPIMPGRCARGCGPAGAETTDLFGLVSGRLYVGRTTTLTAAAGSILAPLLTAAAGEHLWTGWTFAAGWGSRETLDVTLVQPDVVGDNVVVHAQGITVWVNSANDATVVDKNGSVVPCGHQRPADLGW
ncbi:hypothetical protein AB8A21_05435 [Streptomyces sp. BF23-18]|uniref:hypothetical protein n=1 Tax=Streptomyces sp. BF23-18 TaxID=3240282 RepID=UPI0034E5E063